MITKHFSYSSAVRSALDTREPVVALESTVIAHGLPRPQNLETARRLEQIVSEAGATPATIAILNSSLCVGLNNDQLQHIADSDDIRKISTRDLPLAVARGFDGATTVATTSWIAQRAGIQVFATGGIGGVHRGSLPDVSADLPGTGPHATHRRLFRRQDCFGFAGHARMARNSRHNGAGISM